jgi:glycerophosphoryl diester phosphodiesterase
MAQHAMSIVRTSPILPLDQRPAWDTILPMPASRVSTRKPIIIGHRGAAGLAPENTLEGLQVAVDLAIDGIEFDVQRSKDGVPVVFHDEDLDRVTNGTGKVWDRTLAELKALDAAILHEDYHDVRIPTLREAFELLRACEQLLMIEVKEPWRYPGVEEQLVALIREFDLVERSQVRSFYHDVLHAIHRLAPEIAVSELWLDRVPEDDEVIYKTVNCHHILYTAENIARLHRRGVQATAWTVNELDDARRLIAMGIDELTTNYPDRLLTLFA